MSKIRVLVTGGGGFIGSAFLLGCSHDIKTISLDKGNNYPQIQSVIGENVRLIRGDIKDEKLVDELMEEVDVVLHLAGGGGNRACLENPVRSVMDNIVGTRLLVQKAVQHKVKRFLFASTQSVYGTFKKQKMPLTEDMSPNPDDFYAALKMAAELEIMDSFNGFVIFRFANVYGYGSGFGAQWGGVIGKFIKSGCSNSEISVFGTGEQKIDFIHIDDVVRMISMVLENDDIKDEVINAGGGRGTSIKEVGMIVVEVVKRNFGKSININKKLAPSDKIWPDRWLSIEKAKELLSWTPAISLEQGISEMIEKYMAATK